MAQQLFKFGQAVTGGDDLAARLTAALVPVLGATTTIIEQLRALSGGASRSTWAFEAVTGALILRTGPPDDVHAGMELEARSQSAAAAGAPVPHILLAYDSVAALGNPFLVCDEIKGETIVRRIQCQLDTTDGQARRTELLRQCAQALAAIHRADTDITGLTHEDQLVEWREQLDAMNDTTDTLRVGVSLAGRPSAGTIGQGVGARGLPDGNLIVDGFDLAAVLNWELVNLGEAYEDLAWFCIRTWRFGAPGPAWAPGAWARSRTSCANTSTPATLPGPGRVSLVAGAGHAALRRDLPPPVGAASERPIPLGRTRHDRPAGVRDGMGFAQPARSVR